IPALILVACAAIILVAQMRRRSPATGATRAWTIPFYELTPLLLGIAIYGASAVFTALNIGHRHLLPIIPPALILTGVVATPFARASHDGWSFRGGDFLRDRRSRAAVAVVLLLVWHAGESLAIAPHYLAYFNELAGGPSQGYRHLVDSSLDWGQDLPGL